jgi:hypothetical protein
MKNILIVLITFFFSLGTAFSETADHSEASWKEWSAAKPPEKNKWLTLAGLYWLKEGISSIGSAQGNTHQFPKNAPANVGQIEVNSEGVFFSRENDSFKIKLAADTDSKVIFGQFSFQIIQREENYALRLQDSKNPAIKKFHGKSYFPWNKKLVVKAKFIPETTPKMLKIQTVYGTLRSMPAAGWIEFELEGKKYRLHATGEQNSKSLFVMFKDKTSELSTYGAGRYLDIDRPIANNNMVIDFNYAYNPPCAITSFATCPLPPRSNNLQVQINAGEKYHDEH